MKSINRSILAILIGLMLSFLCFAVPSVQAVLALPSETYILENELNDIVSNKKIVCINADVNYDENNNTNSIDYKLFNLFKIKSVKTKQMPSDAIYAGGNAIGINLISEGVCVMSFNEVLTDEGRINVFQNASIKVGDYLLSVNDINIYEPKDISLALDENRYKGGEVLIKYRTGGEEKEERVLPAKEKYSNLYKLGIWIKQSTMGVGTLTFVNDKSLRFGALGHAIYDNTDKEPLVISGGKIFKSQIVGVNKAKNSAAGSLKGMFENSENELGEIDKNVETGIFGQISSSDILNNLKKYDIGGRLTVKTGEAQILSCVEGDEAKLYDIEIIKLSSQKKDSNKSLIFKVTDSELLKKTGGIVQGMSGSPIIQNNKIVGAVTHVLLSDSTRGFGIYIDWMLDK